MKRVPLLMLLLFIMLLSTAFPVEVFTRRQLLEDIDFLVGKIESLFYDPWRKIDEEVFRDLVEEAKSSLKDGMTLSEFFLVAGRITDSLKDQHSGMSFPGEVDVLPFKTREVQGRALVIESGSLIPVGSFILEIEGFAIDELYEKYGSSMGYHESEETGPNIFINWFIHAIPQFMNSPEVEVTYLFNDGILKTAINSVSVSDSDWQMMRNSNRSPAFEQIDSVAVLKIPSFHPDYQEETLELMYRIPGDGYSDLLIDVRDNCGGFQLFLEAVLGYLTKERADLVEKIGTRDSSGQYTIRTWNLPIYPDYSWKVKDSRIWILTNANVNSATLLFLSFMRRNTDAVVIGERSSEPVNFGITNPFHTMPNTGLLFCLSKILVINGAEGEHIEPDLVIEQSLEEEINWYLGNGDATLQKAIDTITGRN